MSAQPRDERQPRRRWVRLREWWSRHSWSVLAVMAAVAFGLAVAGANGNWLDRIRTGVGLLPIGLSPDPDDPILLQIAGILAPLVFAYAVVKGFFVVFAERWQEFLAGRKKDHTVVCGLGNRGQALVESLLESSTRVVALELDPANLAIRRLRDAGAVVLVGDATDPDTLRRVRAARAAHVVSVCGPDAVNAQVAANVLQLAEAEPMTSKSTFVHVGDARLYTFLVHHAVTTKRTRLEFFNVYERGARRLLSKTAELRRKGSPILVVGVGQFGLQLVSRLAYERHELLERDEDAGKLTIHLLDREANARLALLSDKYSRLHDVADLQPLEVDVESPRFDRLLELNPGLAEVGIAYVCFDGDSLSIATALNLLDQANGRFPVAVRVSQRSEGIAELIREAGEERQLHTAAFLPVSIAEGAASAELVLEGIRGQLARDTHERYVRDNPRAPLAKPWDKLTKDEQELNLAHADGIVHQLEKAGYRIGPMLDWGAPLPELTEDEIKRMSEMEHKRWSEERLRRGWRYGPTRDDEAKIHPDLVPWAELPPDRKKINYGLVAERPLMLARVGIELHRNAHPEPQGGTGS